MTETNLKPCPYCGGKAKLTDLKQAPESWVECTECGARTRFFSNSEEAAVSAWNSRPIEEEQAAEIVRLRGSIEAIKKIIEEKRPLSIYDAMQIYAECYDALNGEKE